MSELILQKVFVSVKIDKYADTLKEQEGYFFSKDELIAVVKDAYSEGYIDCNNQDSHEERNAIEMMADYIKQLNL